MTGPAVEAGQGQAYPISVTLEEMAETSGKPVADATKPGEIRLEGDQVPEEFRGKTMAEVLDFQAKMKTALLTSEAARKEAVERADNIAIQAGRQPAQTAPAASTEPKRLTKEELRELHKSDPVAAMEYMTASALSQVVDNFEKRTAGLAGAGQTVAEQNARSRYADEFALFADDIERTKKEVADPSLLADPNNWDRIISYVRGKPGNFEKLVEKKASVATTRAAEEARQQQIVYSGPTLAPSRQPESPVRSGKFDDTTREIIAGLGMTEAEYLKWGGR